LDEIEFDVQSNPLSQLNLPHGTKLKNWKSEKLRSKKRLCSEVSVNSPGIRGVSPEEEKERLRWEGFAEKEGFSLE